MIQNYIIFFGTVEWTGLKKTIIAPYDEGRLKMIDSRTQCKALKLKWIKYIKESYDKPKQDFWYMWLLECLPNMDIKDFLQCNLNRKDMESICN